MRNKFKAFRFRLLKYRVKVKQVTGVQDMVNNANYSMLDPREENGKLSFVVGLPGICKDDISITVTNSFMLLKISHHDYYHELGYIEFWSVKNPQCKFEFIGYEDYDVKSSKVDFDKGILKISFSKKKPETKTVNNFKVK